jgi:hypothetical protein
MADQGFNRPGELGCAERIRADYLRVQPADVDVPADLLNHVAVEIIKGCGVSPLRGHRLARGWTVPQAISAFHAMCRRDNVNPRGLVANSWLEWEAGSRPSWDYQDLVSRLFQTSAVQLGWATDYSYAGAFDRQPDHLSRQTKADRHGEVVVGRARSWRQPMLQLPPDIDDFAGRADQVRELTGFLSAPLRHSGTAIPVAVISGKARRRKDYSSHSRCPQDSS